MNSLPTTIGIVTYNASKFIIEALESAFEQSYPELHLIVSDDASGDNTLAIVASWIAQERVQKRFRTIQLLKVAQNTGVSANCNRVIHAAQTDWIKFHAGDDILLPTCIEDNMKYVSNHTEAKILFSQIQVYQDTFYAANLVKTTPASFPNNLFDPDFDASKQFQILCQSDRIHFTPSYMFHKAALAQVGFYDESERLVEDYPMWLKLTKAGIRLHYFHKPTVGYRIHAQATNNTGAVLFKPSVINAFKIRKKYAHPFLPKMLVLKETWGYYITLGFKKMGITKASSLNKFLYQTTTIYLNPFFWFNTIAKRVTK